MTTECDPDREQRQTPDLGDGGGIPSNDPEGAVLVRNATEKHHALTARGEHDVHTALVRGLASYVAGLESAVDGRLVAMSRVVTDWADHDDGGAPSPSAVVQSVETGKYQTDSGMAPGHATQLAPDGQGRALSITCSGMYKLEELQVTVMCEDKIQRGAVRRMLEEAFWPVEWMSGFRLVLPRYHGAVAVYLLVSATQADATDTATASVWPLVMKLNARCPVYRLHSLPLARVTVTGTIDPGNRRT